MPMTPEEIEKLAVKRARAKMGWYLHACMYVLVNAFWYFSSALELRPRPFNWQSAALGWGLGLALHFVSVFVMGKGSGLRERMVQRERERLQREQNRP